MGKITVFGSFVTDLMFRVPRLPVKGETLKASTFKMGPGGKGANQAVAAKRAGASVVMITKIGKDAFGDIALENFKKENINASFVFQDDDHPTAVASILVDEKTGNNQIAISMGACELITPDEVELARENIENADVLITQLEANLDATELAIDIASKKGVTVILNPAPAPVQSLTDELLKKIDIITPNETEAEILCGIKVEDLKGAKKAAKWLLDKGVKTVIITLGEKGAYLTNNQTECHIEALKVDVIDTTGAGDAYNGGLAAAVAEGMDIIEAARFANVVGALSVTKIGTAPAMPFREDIEKFLKNV